MKFSRALLSVIHGLFRLLFFLLFLNCHFEFWLFDVYNACQSHTLVSKGICFALLRLEGMGHGWMNTLELYIRLGFVCLCGAYIGKQWDGSTLAGSMEYTGLISKILSLVPEDR